MRAVIPIHIAIIMRCLLNCTLYKCTVLLQHCLQTSTALMRFSLSGWSCALLYGFCCIHKISPAPRYLHIMQISQTFCKSQKYTITPFSHNLEKVILQEVHIVSNDLALNTTHYCMGVKSENNTLKHCHGQNLNVFLIQIVMV